MTEVGEVGVCGCPAPPVMLWRDADHNWIVAYPLSIDRDAAADGALYLAGEMTGWAVACLVCSRIFALQFDYDEGEDR